MHDRRQAHEREGALLLDTDSHRASGRDAAEELELLRARLEEAEETLHAIRTGEVDAVVIQGPDGPRTFTLVTADHAYRMLVEQMSEGALTLAPDGLILYSNARLASLLGDPPRSLAGSQLSELAHPDDRAMLSELLQRSATGKASGELRLRHSDGGIVPVQLSLGLLRSGGFDSICAIATDLTDQKQREQAEADDRLTRAIVDHAAEPIVVCDGEGRVIRANRQAADVFGAAIEGCLLEQQCGGALSFADLTTAVTSTTEARRDVALVRSDGSRVFLSVGARPTDRDATAAERKWVVTLTDVSARVRSAERRVQLQALTAALSRSMSREAVSEVVLHQALPAFGAAAGGVLLVDSEAEEFVALGLTGHPDDVNAHWQRFRLGAGIPADEIVRTGNPVVISSAAAWHSRFPNTAPLMAGMGLRSFHGVPVQIGGRVLGVLGLSFREEREPDAEEVELLATLGDQLAQALERVRLYEAQQAALAEAEAANRAKTQFLATMSHELRTPLNAIGGYADLMLAAVHGPLPDAYAEYARRLKSSQQHLLGLINAVLDFARVESGHVTYTVADVGLSDLLSDIQSMVEPQASARGLELSWETCDASLRVMGDAEKIRQILLNLLTNAIKFCESGDRITVACTAEGNHVAIQVSDTGPGIAADRLEHIFEPFVQGDTSRTRPSEGIGLGLAISRQLAEGLGGRLTVESEVGKGSVFTLQLNRVPD